MKQQGKVNATTIHPVALCGWLRSYFDSWLGASTVLTIAFFLADVLNPNPDLMTTILFNVPFVYSLTGAVVFLRLVLSKRPTPESKPIIHQWVGIFAFLLIVETLSYAMEFIGGMMMEPNLDYMLSTHPDVVVMFYSYQYVMLPVLAGYYDIVTGNKDSFMFRVFGALKNKSPKNLQERLNRAEEKLQLPLWTEKKISYNIIDVIGVSISCAGAMSLYVYCVFFR